MLQLIKPSSHLTHQKIKYVPINRQNCDSFNVPAFSTPQKQNNAIWLNFDEDGLSKVTTSFVVIG